MDRLFDTRRHLTCFDSTRTGNILTDILVIGSGVAGARAAIEAAQYGLVTVVAKSDCEDSCTYRAQGGVAAVLGGDDSTRMHFDDTMRVGCGLNDPKAVELLVGDGPARVRELIDWGLAADYADSHLALTREGGHSRNRIVHAGGDRTGMGIVKTLTSRLNATPNVRVFEHCFMIDLITLDGRCAGAITFHRHHGHQLIWAKQTILASGGCGQLWRETTNPAEATGDGLAAAFRAGAELRDMEMMQFHPTTLYVAGAGRSLISEAVRGEGGYLVDRNGERFMLNYHPDAELAPRDVVSLAIHRHLRETRSNCVYLDVRHLQGFSARFPGIARLCADFEIDVSRDLIPVRPSAHYHVGGVKVRLDGATSVDGLFCCGEVASSGVHGANRLASNSLLEGLVFGRLAGQAAGVEARDDPETASVRRAAHHLEPSKRTGLDLSDIRNSLRSLMWRNVGIVREGDRLRETCDILDFWAHYVLDKTFDEIPGWEIQNILTVAKLVAISALERTESTGIHYRADPPACPTPEAYHVMIARDPQGSRPRRLPAVGGVSE